MARRFYIKTMGCQMNEYDSDLVAQSLIRNGFSPVDNPEQADLIVLNTCVVRAKPEQKAFSFLGRMAALKKRNARLCLGVMGCLAQKEGKRLIKRFPYVDFVLGPRELGQVQDIFSSGKAPLQKVVATDLTPPPPHPVICSGYFNKRVTGFISIMEGCDNFCSYCVVPYVRGREASRSPEKILSEAKDLRSQGIREITLLGQNVNSYQWGNENRWDFTTLLHEISRIEGLLRLRFTTSHPKDLSDDLIRCLAEIQNLCPHIHLPFQAGSNRILERMRRGYTREYYLALIRKLREAIPHIAITSDVMVGFPGETDEDFHSTLDLIERVRFDSLFSFKYSDRKGTKAENMGNKLQEAEKGARLATLQNIQKRITLQKNRCLIGKRVQVLVEGVSKKGELTGRTITNKVVNLKGDISSIGYLINVNIESVTPNSLWGQPVNGASRFEGR
ncbi:MAG: tRNA (N6-isopentenyl adenosine(37)-C2)-methylthiotransferase MiaB [Thermodesulfobacteriota bacterium]